MRIPKDYYYKGQLIQQKKRKIDEDAIFIHVKHMPKYPGGNKEIRNFIQSNIRYPEKAVEENIEGTVYLRFVVTKTGTIGKVQIQQGLSELIDSEAIRVVKELATFTPGSQNGRNVNVWYSIPVKFELNKENHDK